MSTAEGGSDQSNMAKPSGVQRARPSPHDALFRRIFGEPVHAASQLRAILPPDLVARLDLDQLIPAPGSFVDAALRWRHCDLLLRTRLDEHDALIYVLVEHQSSPDPLMAWRMLHYLVRIWDRHLTEHPDATRLPAIIPLVVYHGRTPWTAPVELHELLDLDLHTGKAADDLLPRFRFLLDDLTRLDEPDLRTRPLTSPARLTLFLLTTAPGNTHLAKDLLGWSSELRDAIDRFGIDTFHALLTYIHRVGETPPEDLDRLMEQLGPDAQEANMTTADMLRAEGEARGEARGRAEALVQLLTLKFGRPSDTVLATIRAASLPQVEAWTARVLDATSVDNVLS